MNNQEPKHILDGHLSGTLERWRWREAVKFVAPQNAVLDIACNEGGFIDYLPQDVQYLGIDISESAISFARKAHPHHQFMVADLSQGTPQLPQRFDVAVMLAFVEHIKEPQHILSAVNPLLKDGGRVIITTPAPWGRPVHEVGAKIGIFSREGAEDHEKFFNKRDLYDFASNTGYEVERFYYFMFGFNQMICLRKAKSNA